MALDEADAIVMVVDGRTELAAPDLELARLLIRMRARSRVFLAVNKMDSGSCRRGRRTFDAGLPAMCFRSRRSMGWVWRICWMRCGCAASGDRGGRADRERMEGIEEEAEEDEGDFIADESERGWEDT